MPPGCGYWMAYPAIALVTFWSQPILFYFGSFGALVIIVLSNGIMFELLYHRYIKSCIAIACLIVFGSLALKNLSPIVERPAWLSRIGYISPRQLKGVALYDQAYSLKELIHKDTHHSTILMPESMLKAPLNIYPEFFQWWNQGNQKTLVMGAHRYKGGNLLNTAFIISEGGIIDHYDKRCPMAFIEQVPTSLTWIPGLAEVLFDSNQPFCTGDKKMSVNIEGQPFDIQICSDFYMTKERLTMFTLLLVNDDYDISYFTHLLWRGAFYQAITQEVDILYIGHRKHDFIHANGSFLTKEA